MLNKMYFLLIISLLLLSVANVNALTWETECNDTSKLRYYMTFQTCEGGNCTDYNITQYRNCTYGCDLQTQSCTPTPINQMALFSGVFILIGFIAVIFMKALKR